MNNWLKRQTICLKWHVNHLTSNNIKRRMRLEIKVSFIQGGKYELEYKRATRSKQKFEINFCLDRCDWIDFNIRKLLGFSIL